MHALDKLTLAELEKFKLANDQSIAESCWLVRTLGARDRVKPSPLKKQIWTRVDVDKPDVPLQEWLYSQPIEANNRSK